MITCPYFSVASMKLENSIQLLWQKPQNGYHLYQLWSYTYLLMSCFDQGGLEYGHDWLKPEPHSGSWIGINPTQATGLRMRGGSFPNESQGDVIRKKKGRKGCSCCDSVVTNLTSNIHEDSGSIPALTQSVKNPALL